ncbi:hypothetical protein AX16_010414 [Volvariella volvacea WC 439]|nr:hypothetical protein AX16_010414 [Volvariella volvacea WC 439]
MAWLAAGTIFHDLVSPPQDCMDIIVSCIRDALIIFAILTMAVTTVVPFLCQSLLLVRFRSQPYRIVFRALNRPDDPAKDDSSLGADPLVDYYDIWDTLTKDVKHHFYLASVQTHALLAEGKVSEANLDGVIYQYADGVWHRWTTNDTTHQDYAEALLRHHGKKMALLTQVRAWMQCSTKPQSLVDAFAFEGYNYDGIHSQFIERQFYIQKPCALV